MSLLDEHLDLIRAASASLQGPDNTLVRAGGYEFRALPAAEWADAAKMPLDRALVAWALSSEAPSIVKYPQYAYAIGEAIVNAGPALVVKDKRPILNGKFAHQGGRWCASIQQPTRKHVVCAELVLGRKGERNLIANGAVQWTDNDTQHKIHTKAKASGDVAKADRNPIPEEVMRRRYASGRKWIGDVPNIDPWVLSLIGSIGSSEADAMVMLADGRKRWNRPM
jgi:hypothetical protein